MEMPEDLQNWLDTDPVGITWQAEINAVAAGILRWLKRTDCPSHPIISAIKDASISIDDFINGADDVVWFLMDAENWLGDNYRYSDIWACACATAFADFDKPEL